MYIIFCHIFADFRLLVGWQNHTPGPGIYVHMQKKIFAKNNLRKLLFCPLHNTTQDNSRTQLFSIPFKFNDTLITLKLSPAPSII